MFDPEEPKPDQAADASSSSGTSKNSDTKVSLSCSIVRWENACSVSDASGSTSREIFHKLILSCRDSCGEELPRAFVTITGRGGDDKYAPGAWNVDFKADLSQLSAPQSPGTEQAKEKLQEKLEAAKIAMENCKKDATEVRSAASLLNGLDRNLLLNNVPDAFRLKVKNEQLFEHSSEQKALAIFNTNNRILSQFNLELNRESFAWILEAQRALPTLREFYSLPEVKNLTAEVEQARAQAKRHKTSEVIPGIAFLEGYESIAKFEKSYSLWLQGASELEEIGKALGLDKEKHSYCLKDALNSVQAKSLEEQLKDAWRSEGSKLLSSIMREQTAFPTPAGAKISVAPSGILATLPRANLELTNQICPDLSGTNTASLVSVNETISHSNVEAEATINPDQKVGIASSRILINEHGSVWMQALKDFSGGKLVIGQDTENVVAPNGVTLTFPKLTRNQIQVDALVMFRSMNNSSAPLNAQETLMLEEAISGKGKLLAVENGLVVNTADSKPVFLHLIGIGRTPPRASQIGAVELPDGNLKYTLKADLK